jgi:molybdate transport system regulatory protein
MTKLTLRVEFGPERAIGPGKVRLLELIQETGSIAAAGRAMGMSYRRAWLLVDSLNRCFHDPVVVTQLGGASGGGAALTTLGESVVGHYRAMELEAQAAVGARLEALGSELAGRGRERARAERRRWTGPGRRA